MAKKPVKKKVAKKKNDNAGQPPYYKTPKELQAKIDEYFKNPPRHKTIYNKDGDIVAKVPKYMVGELAYYLGFATRQSLDEQAKRVHHHDKFSYIVKRSKLFIENEYEALLDGNNVTGIIFALKNMGWKDTQDINVGGQKDNPVITIDKETNDVVKLLSDSLQGRKK